LYQTVIGIQFVCDLHCVIGSVFCLSNALEAHYQNMELTLNF